MIQSLYYYLFFAVLFVVIDYRMLKQQRSLVSFVIYGVLVLIGAGIFYYLDHSFEPVYLFGLFSQ